MAVRAKTSALVRMTASLVVMAAALSSCAIQGLAFEQDDRIAFISPDYRQKVTLPFTIEWSIEDFELTGPTGIATKDAGYVEIVFDRQPQPPGEGVEYFARDDISCRQSEGCPDARYLAQRGIFTTTDTSFTVRPLPPAPGVDLERGEADIHNVILILLDGEGRRIGESAWSNYFEVIHDD